jgi:hypothetical protein
MSDLGLFLLVFAALFCAVLLIRFFAWLTDVRDAGGPIAYFRQASGRYVVSTNASGGAVVMSRSQNTNDGFAASALQTDDRQTTDRRTMPVPTRDQMLDIFKVVRAAGIKRDQLAGAWRAAGLPLDNNVWADAAPAEQPAQHFTPIVGRPTNAVFESDPDFPYVQPPA